MLLVDILLLVVHEVYVYIHQVASRVAARCSTPPEVSVDMVDMVSQEMWEP